MALVSSDYVVRSPQEDVDLPRGDVYSTYAARLDKFGSRIALVDGTTGIEHSYHSLHQDVCSFLPVCRELAFINLT